MITIGALIIVSFLFLAVELKRIEQKLDALTESGRDIMALQDDLLAAAQQQATVVDSIVALLTELRNTTGDATTKAALDIILADTAKLQGALTTTPSGGEAPVT